MLQEVRNFSHRILLFQELRNNWIVELVIGLCSVQAWGLRGTLDCFSSKAKAI